MNCYDRHGSPISTERWAALIGDMHTKRVAEDDVITPGGRCLWVSTVWLGLDQSFGRGVPLIFESMVFEKGWDDVAQVRYSTEAQALAGHAALVSAAREGLLEGAP